MHDVDGHNETVVLAWLEAEVAIKTKTKHAIGTCMGDDYFLK